MAFKFSSAGERIVQASGLAHVGIALSNAFSKVKDVFAIDASSPEAQIPFSDIIRSFVGTLLSGSADFEGVNSLHDDPEFYAKALEIDVRIPSEASLRQRIDKFGALPEARENMRQLNVALIQANNMKISPIVEDMVNIDADVSPFDNGKTKKEGIGRTYKGCDGYAPMMAYMGKEGICINTEFRPGTQHCQKHTPEFLQETISLARQVTDKQLLMRLDSGNDAGDNIAVCQSNDVHYIIKRNLRDEAAECWLDIAMHEYTDISHPRDGKIVYKGTCYRDTAYTAVEQYTTKCGKVKSHAVKKKINDVRVVYELTVRYTDKKGQALLFPDIEVDTYWTDLGWSEDRIINLYHSHGESEQYHSEFKTDLDLERLPSGKYTSNSLVLDLGTLALNIARLLSQELMEEEVPLKQAGRRRVKTIIRFIIRMAAHITTHAGSVSIGLGDSNSFADAFRNIYYRLLQRQKQLRAA